MTSEPQVAAVQGSGSSEHSEYFARWNELQRRKADAWLRVSDLQVKLSQLQEQKATVNAVKRLQFNQPIAETQHQLSAAMLEFESVQSEIARMDQVNQPPVIGALAPGEQPSPTASLLQPPPDPLFGQKQLEYTGIGAFLLMIPIVFALARRLWVRGGTWRQPAFDLESSPRLQRMEQAIEAIGVEVERIGEAQRFTTKLLSERRPEAVANRVTPVASPKAHREPGTITPH
jgi:hypothetical protein